MKVVRPRFLPTKLPFAETVASYLLMVHLQVSDVGMAVFWTLSVAYGLLCLALVFAEEYTEPKWS